MRVFYLVACAIPVLLQAQVASRDSVVTVSASRTSRVLADRATFFVAVDGTAETPADAVARVEVKLKAVMEALKAQGASLTYDQPLPYSVGLAPNNNGYPQIGSPPPQLARTIIRVSTTKPEVITRALAALLTAGAAGASPAVWEVSNIDSIRRTRIAEVLGVARADAEAIATALNMHLGTLVDVSSNSTPNFQGPSYLNFDTRFSQPSTTAPEVQVVTSVSVRYRLVR